MQQQVEELRNGTARPAVRIHAVGNTTTTTNSTIAGATTAEFRRCPRREQELDDTAVRLHQLAAV